MELPLLPLPHLICVCLLLPIPAIAQTNKNITLGSSLHAGESTSSWVSPSKHFAFGFQEIVPGNFLLAIWFNQIPERTITWSANRNDPAPTGSKVTVTIDGDLVLASPSGHEIWKVQLSSGNSKRGRIAYAAMLDIGNFVLATQASTVLWQSFDEPTDTLLPTQTLNLGGQLLARFREKNYSSGRFTFTLQDPGNLQLFTTEHPLFNNLRIAYKNYSISGLGHQVVFTQTGLLYLIASNGSILTDVFSDKVSKSQVLYQRLVLEYDGVLRHYVYRNQSSHPSRGWSINSFDPENICTAAIQKLGGGVCGYNSYCKLKNNSTDGKPQCICPPGYTLINPDDEMSGCFQNFLAQRCEEEASHENNQFNFKVLQDVDWPFSNYEHFHNVTVDWCRNVCLMDCFCAVAMFRDGGECWKKKLPLTHGNNDGTVERMTFVKVRTMGGFITQRQYKKSKRVWTSVLATLGSANIVLLGCIVIGFFYFQNRKTPKINGIYNVRSFSYKELSRATNKFSEELGRGAFGVVYKGVLNDPSSMQTFIAVKKLNGITQDADNFKTEVNTIGHTHHKNLVKLMGFCEEDENRLLVYEFMSNGTLSEFLYKPPKPAWEKRLQIAQGIARGLFYLHEDCSTQVIHCDIKPQNILLDDDHNARISDFGLAKLLRLDQTQTITAPRGTRGYVAPEWFKNLPITAKVDVYSFGILLLEIICCQRNVQCDNNEEGGVVLLTDWAFDCYQKETCEELVNEDMEALNDRRRVESMVKIVIWCIQDDPNLRPTMRRVVEMLEGLVQIPEPPCPAL